MVAAAAASRPTTPETQPWRPLSQVLPLSAIGAALSQQKVPRGRAGYNPSGTKTHVRHRVSAQQSFWQARAVAFTVLFILIEA